MNFMPDIIDPVGYNGENCTKYNFIERSSRIIEWYKVQMELKDEYKVIIQHYRYKDEYDTMCFKCGIIYTPENPESKDPSFVSMGTKTQTCLNEFEYKMKQFILKQELDKKLNTGADRKGMEFRPKIKKLR